jgi:hypothetical protein
VHSTECLETRGLTDWRFSSISVGRYQDACKFQKKEEEVELQTLLFMTLFVVCGF